MNATMLLTGPPSVPEYHHPLDDVIQAAFIEFRKKNTKKSELDTYAAGFIEGQRSLVESFYKQLEAQKCQSTKQS